MTVFDRIKELADSKKVSLKKVSSDLNFGENYIYNLRYSKTPNADKLALIADYFNVSVDYLLGRDEAKPINEPIDLAEVANSDDDAVWSRLLSSGGRPLTEKDKLAIKLLFSDKWDEITQKAKDLDNKD
nr:helix-turn-helix transcriptional regulator [Lactococcus lactis]